MLRGAELPPRTFLGQLSLDEREQLLARWPRRRFSAGSVVIERGQVDAGMYVMLAGAAEVLAPEHSGATRRLALVGTGDLLGELGLFSGQATSSTVRAVTDIEVLAVDGDEARDAARELPWLYPALGSVVAARLVRTQRQLLAAPTGRVIVLRDEGAPPLLPVALSASIAWHTRGGVLLVLRGAPTHDLPVPVHDAADGDALIALAARLGDERGCRVTRLAVPCDASELTATLRRAAELVPTVILCAPRSFPLDVGADIEAVVAPPIDARTRPTEGPLAIVAWARAAGRGEVAVREPRGQELTDLGSGRIGLSGPAGRDLGRAARWLIRHRVGLALGSGSARGFAHIGVLRAFARLGVPVDAVAGTSIGAAVATLHACGDTPDQIFDMLSHAGRLAVRPFGTGRSLLSIAGIRTLIERHDDGRRIEELTIPLAVVAADLDTGEEVVLDRGALAPAVLASLAIPGVYPPQHVAGRRLIDGAFVDPVPVDVTASLGVDKVVAVRLATRPPIGRVATESVVTRSDPLWAPQVILRSIDVMAGALGATAATAADALIEPSFHGIGGSLRDFRRGREYERVGEAATQAALPALAAALPWVDA
jgi:NTE family protein